MVVLRARALLADLLDAAPPQRRSPVTWRLRRAEELASGNFPLIWVRRCGAGRVVRAARRAAPVQSAGIAALRPGSGCRISLTLRKHCHSTSLVTER